MTSRLCLLFMSMALAVTLGLPVRAAMQTHGNVTAKCCGVCATMFDVDELSVPPIHGRADNDDGCIGALGNPAPAGTVAAGTNRPIGKDTPPVAVTN